MSTLRKRADRKSMIRRNDNLVGADVTIDDFANTLRIRARLKKSVTNVSKEVKQEALIQEEKTEWSETDEKSMSQNFMKGNKHKVTPVTNAKKRGKKSICQDNDEEEAQGINYPLDIWFIISEYIRPEAVGKFARICKSSYYVTTTGKFWFHLYKSYYKFVSNLPERLQPQCTRLHGLRACVIRALHYSYFTTLLQRGLSDMSYLRQEEPHSLVKRKCTLMWHKEGKVRWYFYFKLKEISKTRNNSFKENKRCDKKTEFLQMLEDVAVNPEEGCKVLKVTCLRYSMLPPVLGLILQTVSMNLMPGFREHKLQLGFGTSDIPSTLTNHEVILRDVTEYRILDWWNPAYPHQDANYPIELMQNDSWD